MARPEKYTVDYFPHPVEHGKKMFFIQSKYKNDGYATWFRILEMLGKTSYHFLDLRDMSTSMFLSSLCNINEDKLFEIIEDLVRLGEFHNELWTKYRVLFNEKFIENIEDAYKRRTNDCLHLPGLCKHLTITLSVNVGNKQVNDDINTHTILDYTKEDNTILNDTKDKKPHSFQDSEFYDFDKFKSKMVNTKYELFNIEFYYESVKNWSESSGKKKKNWIATAKGFMTRDYQDKKAVYVKGLKKDESKIGKIMAEKDEVYEGIVKSLIK